MGKLYHTEEVKQVLDKKLNDLIMTAANDKELTGSALGSVIERVRLMRAFADEVIEDMKVDDAVYEEEMAKWRAKQKAQEAKKDADS